MAASDRRHISAPPDPTYVVLTIFLLLANHPAGAQNTPSRPRGDEDRPYNTSVSPALAILVVAVVSAFFLLGFFSIYFRRCTGDRSAVAPGGALVGMAGVRPRNGEAQRGLDPALLELFPTMVYSSVKKHKQGKEPLECAVCLCEFQDDDVLRLLPRCSHVFHRDCIDIWLSTHVTCPVCRTNLADVDPVADVDHVVVPVGEDGDREAELTDLVRIGSQRRDAVVAAGARSRSGSVRRMPTNSPSTADWTAAITGGSGERFRLRLPEDLRREFLAARRLRRSASFAVFPSRGEGSSRRGYRDGGNRMWRSLRLGQSGRWPFLGRSSSSARGRGDSATDGSSFPGRNGDGNRRTDVSETSTVLLVKSQS